MNTSRIAWLSACLALPAFAVSAMAQPADGARVIQVPPGAVVLILGGPGVSTPAAAPVFTAADPDAVPVLRLIAQQQKMLQRMMAGMDALFPPMPDPEQMIQAAMGGGGHGICGESVSYSFNGPGSQPVVHVAHYGDACGTSGTNAPRVITAQEPAAPATPPPVLDIGYPAHPITVGRPPRT